MSKNRTRRITTAGVLISILLLIVASCGGGGGSSGGTPATSTVEVVACNTVTPSVTVSATPASRFDPSGVTIPVNGVVQWTSTSTLRHTVTSGTGGTPDGKFDQELASSGATVCLRFTAAGTYNYYCTPHVSMGMTGIVTVQ